MDEGIEGRMDEGRDGDKDEEKKKSTVGKSKMNPKIDPRGAGRGRKRRKTEQRDRKGKQAEAKKTMLAAKGGPWGPRGRQKGHVGATAGPSCPSP